MVKLLIATTLAVTSLVVSLDASSTPPPTAWQLPFMSPHRLIRPYLQPTSDYSAGHRGVDYGVAAEEAVFAPANGVISFAGRIVDREIVAIEHDGSFVSELEPVCTTLKVGDHVLKGAMIGKVCQPAADYRKHCEVGDCLHFSLRLSGKYLSPLALIGGLNPSRLLPYARG